MGTDNVSVYLVANDEGFVGLHSGKVGEHKPHDFRIGFSDTDIA
jgi:hypothetical protein